MKTLDTLPGESNTSIISSIINSVCPQCGGRMSEFQCEGRCRRNWLAESEWANQATRNSNSRDSQAMHPVDALTWLAMMFAILVHCGRPGARLLVVKAVLVSVSWGDNIFLARHLQRLVTSESSRTLMQKLFEGENL